MHPGGRGRWGWTHGGGGARLELVGALRTVGLIGALDGVAVGGFRNQAESVRARLSRRLQIEKTGLNEVGIGWRGEEAVARKGTEGVHAADVDQGPELIARGVIRQVDSDGEVRGQVRRARHCQVVHQAERS